MPSIYSIKPAFQNLLRPITRWLANHGISANQITVSALLLSLLTGLVLTVNYQQTQIFFLIPFLLLVRMALNAIDGMLAREHDMKSPLGAILNELCDVISDVALYLPFALLPSVSIWLVVFVVISSIITEMTGIIGIQIGASRRYDGPMGKSDRAFIFGAIALALAFGLHPATWLNGLLCIILLLTLVTSFNRARQALAEINS
jgi:CDP-diacylglycerol---glycerol-3-phosphate 3-phosphatidyltransferase